MFRRYLNRSYSRRLAYMTILAILLGISPVGIQPVVAQRPGVKPVNADTVQEAIDLSVRFLLDGQLPDGGWPQFRQYPHGVTGLVTLALLNSGLDPEHPKLAQALQSLSGQELSQTYTVGLQTMALCAANPNKYATVIERNARWLIDMQLDSGGWGYGRENANYTDPSNSQFALLALHEAQRAGAALSDDEWKLAFGRAKRYWETLQNADGSFQYPGQQPSGSMTCAGIASLVIVGAQVDDLESSGGEFIQCCGTEQSNQDRIEAGLAWMARNFRADINPGSSLHVLYYIYALERVGRLTGSRFIGDHDWYREGAFRLINLQESVTGRIAVANGQGNYYTETAFALLFLSKGKRQTVINRLQYSGRQQPRSEADWNHHSNAMHHLTAHTEQAWKRDLSWQNIDLSQSTVTDLLETPVLFISGTKAPAFTLAQKQVLKEYVDQGGFIFAEACQGNGCDGAEFEAYFRNLVVELWDQPLEKLSPDHPIWYAESRVVPDDLPKDTWLYGVQTCCRLGVVYAPFSLSCRWELNLPYGIKPDFSRQVQDELDTATKIGINVLAYATGKELKEKLDTVTILEEVRNLAPTDRNVLTIPTLRHNAGSDDAPRTIPNLMQWLDRSNPFQLSSEKKIIGITDEELKQHLVVFMHGRGKLEFSEVQRDVLRQYLHNGGFIFADAICADEEFATSFRREMQIILDEPLSPLESSHSMFTRAFYGFDIQTVQMIDPDLSGDSVITSQRRIAPRLESAKVENRIAVVFSPLDISCALESRHSLQCRGYIREDAARIGINVILFALQH